MPDNDQPRLAYHRGTLVCPAPEAARLGAPFAWDARAGVWRASAHRYADAVTALPDGVADGALRALDVPEALGGSVTLRDYQAEALAAWERAGKRGVVALPTGAGKTFIALRAFEEAGAATLVVTPTLDLVDQWIARARSAFPKARVAKLAGGRGLREVEAITVATYDSAYLHADKIGDRFALVVFDECHHLPSEGYRQIAEMLVAPMRLGLSATPEREDGLHALLPDLVGPIVARLTVRDLSGKHLAPYDAVRLDAHLDADERERYEADRAVWHAYVAGDASVGRRPHGHKQLVMRSASDPAARRALLARERMRDVMFNARSKRAILAGLLEKHRGARTIVFTEHNRLVAALSREFLLPAITHRTPTPEREEVLSRFRSGAYPVVVTSKVLDEGVDVPEASVAIILSGSGSVREFTQRLGRILRPDVGKRATLYEVVTRDTGEERTSERRTRHLKDAKPANSAKSVKAAKPARAGSTPTTRKGKGATSHVPP